MSKNLNLKIQNYKGLPLQLINRNYKYHKAKRYLLNGTGQNVWIPNTHLDDDGTIKDGQNIDYVFAKAGRQLELAGMKIVFQKIKEEDI